MIAGLLTFGSLVIDLTDTTHPGDPSSVAWGAPATTAKPLFADWPTPQAALVFSGDAHGYLEPCGCSERQSGGMARRGDLLRQIREDKQWPVAAFDVGGTINESRISYPQTLIKFSAMLKGLNDLNYQGLALGKEELLLGAQEIFTQYANSEAEEAFDVPFLGSNVTIFGSKDLGTPSDSRIITLGGLKIGVVAVAGNTTRNKLSDAGALRDENELQIRPPREVIPAVLERMKAEQPQLLVLLSHSEMEESMQLAREFPQFRIVVTAESREDPSLEPVYVGNTLLVQVGKKGKYAAVVGILPNQTLKYELVELDMDRFQTLPIMHELMRHYQENLTQAYPQLISQTIADPVGGTYVGAAECKSCHETEYEIWANSGHFKAYESLSIGRHGQEANWVSRIHDPECLSCHVTGWDAQRALRRTTGFVDINTSAHLAGQQCENCHGPGSEHVSLEKAVQAGGPVSDAVLSARSAVQLTLERARKDVCVSCHDLDNSPDFDFDTYWPSIEH